MRRMFVRVATVMVLAAVTACSSGPLQISGIQVGKSINPDKSVNAHTTRFKPTDTFYVSVISEGRGAGTIQVEWTYGGRSISKESREVSYNDHAATEFHIASPSPWPAGSYKVDVLVDGAPAESREFRVD